MKKIKHFLCSLLAISLFLSVPSIQTFAQSNTQQVISVDTYTSAMKNLYAKYGVEYKFLGKDGNTVLTQSLLEQNLAINEKKLQQASKEPEVTSSPIHILGLMPYTSTQMDYQQVNSPSGLGYANFAIALASTRDANRGVYLTVNDYTCAPYGKTVNFNSWNLNNKSYSFLSSQKICRTTFNITLNIEWTEPTTGIKGGYISYHTITSNFHA